MEEPALVEDDQVLVAAEEPVPVEAKQVSIAMEELQVPNVDEEVL